MYDSITETYTQYEQACSKCIDDLYRTAYLVLVDADAAEKSYPTFYVDFIGMGGIANVI